MRRGGADHVPGAEDVDPQDALPDLVRRRVEVVVRDHHRGAGVVDHDVESAVLLDGRVNESLCLGGIGDVGLHVDRVGEVVGDLLSGGDRRGRVHDHARTEVREGLRHCRADPGRGTGDQRDAALQVGALAHGVCRGDWIGW